MEENENRGKDEERRERDREASRRARKRKKEKLASNEEEIERLRKANEELQQTVDDLRAQLTTARRVSEQVAQVSNTTVASKDTDHTHGMSVSRALREVAQVEDAVDDSLVRVWLWRRIPEYVRIPGVNDSVSPPDPPELQEEVLGLLKKMKESIDDSPGEVFSEFLVRCLRPAGPCLEEYDRAVFHLKDLLKALDEARQRYEKCTMACSRVLEPLHHISGKTYALRFARFVQTHASVLRALANRRSSWVSNPTPASTGGASKEDAAPPSEGSSAPWPPPCGPCAQAVCVPGSRPGEDPFTVAVLPVSHAGLATGKFSRHVFFDDLFRLGELLRSPCACPQYPDTFPDDSVAIENLSRMFAVTYLGTGPRADPFPLSGSRFPFHMLGPLTPIVPLLETQAQISARRSSASLFNKLQDLRKQVSSKARPIAPAGAVRPAVSAPMPVGPVPLIPMPYMLPYWPAQFSPYMPSIGTAAASFTAPSPSALAAAAQSFLFPAVQTTSGALATAAASTAQAVWLDSSGVQTAHVPSSATHSVMSGTASGYVSPSTSQAGASALPTPGQASQLPRRDSCSQGPGDGKSTADMCSSSGSIPQLQPECGGLWLDSGSGAGLRHDSGLAAETGVNLSIQPSASFGVPSPARPSTLESSLTWSPLEPSPAQSPQLGSSPQVSSAGTGDRDRLRALALRPIARPAGLGMADQETVDDMLKHRLDRSALATLPNALTVPESEKWQSQVVRRSSSSSSSSLSTADSPSGWPSSGDWGSVANQGSLRELGSIAETVAIDYQPARSSIDDLEAVASLGLEADAWCDVATVFGGHNVHTANSSHDAPEGGDVPRLSPLVPQHLIGGEMHSGIDSAGNDLLDWLSVLSPQTLMSWDTQTS